MSPEFSRSKSPSHKVGCFLSKFSHFAPAGRAGTGAGEEAGWQLVAPEQADRQSWEGIWGEGWGPPLPASATCSAGPHPLLTAESKSPGGQGPHPDGLDLSEQVPEMDSRVEAAETPARVPWLLSSPVIVQGAPSFLQPHLQSSPQPPVPRPRGTAWLSTHLSCSRKAQQNQPTKLTLKVKVIQGAKHAP